MSDEYYLYLIELNQYVNTPCNAANTIITTTIFMKSRLVGSSILVSRLL